MLHTDRNRLKLETLILDSTTDGYGSINCIKTKYILVYVAISAGYLARIFEKLLFALFQSRSIQRFYLVYSRCLSGRQNNGQPPFVMFSVIAR